MKTSPPLVSIIIPIYNAEKYLRKCLDSVVNQTLKNIEVFCIDDGSVDNSWDIIQEYAKRDKRIIAIKQKNSGAAVARNKGLEKAIGEYIGFVDSDDWVDLDYFDKLYRTAKNHEADISVAYVRADSDGDSDSDYVKMVLMNDSRVYEDMYNIARKRDVQRSKLYLHSVIWLSIFKRSMLEEHKIAFYPELRTGQDNIFLVETSYYANKVVYVNTPTYYYRVARDGSLMSEYNFTDKGLLTRTLVLRRVVDFFNSKPDYSKEVYVKRLIGNLSFMKSRLQHAKSAGAINAIAKRVISVWRKTKYKEDIMVELDGEFVHALGSRRRLFLYIYKISHPHSLVIRTYRQGKRIIKVILPYGMVAVYGKYKTTRDLK